MQPKGELRPLVAIKTGVGLAFSRFLRGKIAKSSFYLIFSPQIFPQKKDLVFKG